MLIKGILSVFKRELYEVVKSPLYLSVVAVLPIVMLLTFTAIFYNGKITELPITVVDNDNSAMSRQLCSMIDATPGVDIALSAESIGQAESQNKGCLFARLSFCLCKDACNEVFKASYGNVEYESENEADYYRQGNICNVAEKFGYNSEVHYCK